MKVPTDLMEELERLVDVELAHVHGEIDPAVHQELERLRLRDQAQRLFRSEQAAALGLPEVLSVDHLLQMVPADPLLGDLLFRDTLAQVSGRPGTFKSFIAVGMACAIASGRNWGRHEVYKQASVLYVAAEGGAGVGLRMAAWCRHHGIAPSEIGPWFHTMAAPIQLGVDSHVEHLLAEAERIQPDLIVVDTRARSTVGLEENSATDQGVAIENLERVRRATGACALVVHHTGRSGESRGSTAWPGAVWTDIELKRTGLDLDANGEPLGATLTVTKHKDAEIPLPCSFDLESVRVPRTWMPNVSRTAQLSTLVAVPAEQSHTSVETKASRDERKGDEGQAIRAWLLAQHAETGTVPGRTRVLKWMGTQGLKLGNDPLAALIREVKAGVES